MKKTIFLLAVALIASATSFAQDITINVSGSTTDVAGQVHTEYLNFYGIEQHVVDFNINNDSAGDKTWIITRRILNETPGWSNYFCWGVLGQIGTCYDASVSEYFYSGLVTIPAGESGLLAAYVSAPASGSALYRYYVTTADSSVFEDSIDLQINGFVGIDEISSLSLNTYPNPANDVINIEADVTNGSMQLIDLMGNIVMKDDFDQSHSLNVAEIKSGVYFIIIESEGILPTKKKIVIQH